MKTTALATVVLLMLTACTNDTPGTPKPNEETGEAEKCGEVICVTQKRPECNGKRAVWRFEVFHVDRSKNNKTTWKYTRTLTDVVGVSQENIEKEDLVPVINKHIVGLAKEPEKIVLYGGALTVNFVSGSDGYRYKLNWNDVCGKDA